MNKIHNLLLLESEHRSQAFSLVKHIEGGVDVVDVVAVGDEFVDEQLLVEVVLDEFWHTVDRLPSSERGSFPRASRDKLEWARGDFLTGSGDSNNARYSPSFVSGFKSLAHGMHISDTLKSVIESSIVLIDEVSLEAFSLWQLNALRIDTFGGSEEFGRLEFGFDKVDSNDSLGSGRLGSHDDSESDGAESPNGDGASLFDFACVEHCSIPCRNTASQK